MAMGLDEVLLRLMANVVPPKRKRGRPPKKKPEDVIDQNPVLKRLNGWNFNPTPTPLAVQVRSEISPG